MPSAAAPEAPPPVMAMAWRYSTLGYGAALASMAAIGAAIVYLSVQPGAPSAWAAALGLDPPGERAHRSAPTRHISAAVGWWDEAAAQDRTAPGEPNGPDRSSSPLRIVAPITIIAAAPAAPPSEPAAGDELPGATDVAWQSAKRPPARSTESQHQPTRLRANRATAGHRLGVGPRPVD